MERSPKLSAFPPATLQILLALLARDLHGYGIIQEVLRQSEEKVRIGPGTLYDNLKRLMEQGLVKDVPPTGKEERRLYRLTSAGRVALASEIERLDRVVTDARKQLARVRPGRAT